MPSRRDVLAGAGAAALLPVVAQAQGALLRRPIPHGKGESLPAVGLGTAVVFNTQEKSGPTAVV
ncbi:MAG TPA: aldo/keto reductase, partial [Reyranella sp.]|nr:aldo/keto reductase [Reyranella sp.]